MISPSLQIHKCLLWCIIRMVHNWILDYSRMSVPRCYILFPSHFIHRVHLANCKSIEPSIWWTLATDRWLHAHEETSSCNERESEGLLLLAIFRRKAPQRRGDIWLSITSASTRNQAIHWTGYLQESAALLDFNKQGLCTRYMLCHRTYASVCQWSNNEGANDWRWNVFHL